jgi:hypothetical protein
MAKIFPFTRKVGSPQASTSAVSGNARQMRRSRSTAASEGGIFVGCFFAAGFLFAVDDFGADFLGRARFARFLTRRLVAAIRSPP